MKLTPTLARTLNWCDRHPITTVYGPAMAAVAAAYVLREHLGVPEPMLTAGVGALGCSGMLVAALAEEWRERAAASLTALAER